MTEGEFWAVARAWTWAGIASALVVAWGATFIVPAPDAQAVADALAARGAFGACAIVAAVNAAVRAVEAVRVWR